MIINNKVGGQALLMGGVATWLTAISSAEDWLMKDYIFVLAVVVVVLIGGLRKTKYERLTQHELLRKAHDLENIEYIHGNSVQLKANQVTCILFFGTWCKESRKALEFFAGLHSVFSLKGVQFIGLTQESRAELEMYEVKGRNASNFRQLGEFAFSIGIETGLMSKKYLVQCDLFTVPQLFIVGKNQTIVSYGDPCANIVEARLLAALEEIETQITL